MSRAARIALNWTNGIGRIAAAVLALTVAITPFAGCGQGSAIELHGVVSHDGAPVEHGMMRFVPIGETTGSIAVAAIENGAFRVEDSSGLMAGTYRVEIDAWKEGRPLSGPPRGDRPPQTAERVRIGSEIYSTADSPLQVTLTAGLRAPLTIEIPAN
jgi:hypothetical protein